MRWTRDLKNDLEARFSTTCQGIGAQPCVTRHFSYLNLQISGLVPLAVQAAWTVPIALPSAAASGQTVVTEGFLEKRRSIAPGIVTPAPPSGELRRCCVTDAKGREGSQSR